MAVSPAAIVALGGHGSAGDGTAAEQVQLAVSPVGALAVMDLVLAAMAASLVMAALAA